MPELTPETLRAVANTLPAYDNCIVDKSLVRDCASAWAADLKRIEALARGRNEIHGKWFGTLLRIEALEKENRALRANASKSVLRRLEGQGILRGEEPSNG